MKTEETDLTDSRSDAELTDSRTGADQLDAEPAIVGGLDENVAGALAYFLAPFIGLVLYLIEDENEFVRFHAVQSMIVFGGVFVVAISLGVFQSLLAQISFVGWIFAIVVGFFSLLLFPIAFVLWLVLVLKAYGGNRYGLPVVGDIAEKYV